MEHLGPHKVDEHVDDGAYVIVLELSLLVFVVGARGALATDGGELEDATRGNPAAGLGACGS